MSSDGLERRTLLLALHSSRNRIPWEPLDGGWQEIMERNRELAIRGRRFSAGIGTSAPVPDSMVSSIAAVEMPDEGDVGPMSLEGILITISAR